MEDILIQISQSQGIWTVLFVFLLLYTIKKNETLDQKQEEREQKYQEQLSDLTDKYSLLAGMDKQLNSLCRLIRNQDKEKK